jgi:enoyl-CoA hydratase/carnithine racemase
MSLVSDIAPTPEAALTRAVELATKIAAVPPQSAKTTLASAHDAIDDGEEKAFAAAVPAFIRLMKSEDFQERVRATQEKREPVYKGR